MALHLHNTITIAKDIKNLVQWNLDYPDLDYPDYSIIQTLFSGPNFFKNIN